MRLIGTSLTWSQWCKLQGYGRVKKVGVGGGCGKNKAIKAKKNATDVKLKHNKHNTMHVTAVTKGTTSQNSEVIHSTY